MGYTIITLLLISLIPVLFSVGFTFLNRFEKYNKLKTIYKDIIAGIVFGVASILGTVFGVTINGDFIINARDSAPIIAGLAISGPSGIIAGIIGGLYRFVSVYWGGSGAFTQIACSVSTVLAGLVAALARKVFIQNKTVKWYFGILVAVFIEDFHMMMVFLTHMEKTTEAFDVVKACMLPMILVNAFSVTLSLISIALINKQKLLEINKKKHIATIIQFSLLGSLIAAYAVISSFSYGIIKNVIERNMSGETADLAIKIAFVGITIAEIFVFLIAFTLIYVVIKKRVINGIEHVSDSLNEIADGDLNVIVDEHSSYELNSLSKDINETVSSLKELIATAEKKNKEELLFAKTIQLSVIPNDFPLDEKFEIYALMKTAKEVGGDFYDFYYIDKDHVLILIADVSGKGIPAALFMMRAKSILQSLIINGMPINDAFTETNRRLCEGNVAQMFVTAWAAMITLSTGHVECVNAGHNPPLVGNKEDGFKYYKGAKGFVLAGLEGFKYKKFEFDIKPGDRIFLYTDGVTEATALDMSMFGEERLVQSLTPNSNLTPRETCTNILSDVYNFVEEADQSDDITMLCFKYNEPSKDKVIVIDATVDNLYKVIDFVEASLREKGFSDKNIISINVALDEIVSNVCFYAYKKGQIGQLKVSLRFSHNDSEVEIKFEDRGIPYNPLDKPDPNITLSLEEREPGGLGIYIVKKSMDEVLYEYSNLHNILTIRKINM